MADSTRAQASADSLSNLNECFTKSGQEFDYRNGSAIFGPRCPIHADVELPVRRKGTFEEDFEIFISTIILDRNSQVCFHKGMVTGRVRKTNRAQGRARPVA